MSRLSDALAAARPAHAIFCPFPSQQTARATRASTRGKKLRRRCRRFGERLLATGGFSGSSGTALGGARAGCCKEHVAAHSHPPALQRPGALHGQKPARRHNAGHPSGNLGAAGLRAMRPTTDSFDCEPLQHASAYVLPRRGRPGTRTTRRARGVKIVPAAWVSARRRQTCWGGPREIWSDASRSRLS